ncbi:unnamed protein product, partial [Adineta steineri]
MNSDVLLIAFHHAAFDRASFPIFFDVLCFAYNTNAISIEDDDESLQYIDYAVHEHLIDMTKSREFWYSQFEGFNLKRRLSLPIDQRGSPNDQRSSCASIAQIFFENEISQLFRDYASIHHVTPFQLGLSILYAFLFKLTHGENDLCISCHNANRYRPELQNIIGMFVSTLPYRVELDPHWSFDDLVKYVQEKCLSVLEHSHYPLQHILSDFHLNQSTVPFLQTVFDFITVSSVNDQFTFDDVSLQPVSVKEFPEVAKFDFKVIFVYNPMAVDNILSCRFTCSRDLFEDTTVTKMIQRFQYLFEQIFSMNLNVNQTDLIVSPIAKLTLILPDEVNEMQQVAFYRQSNVTNEAPASFAQARIWLDEQIRFNSNQSQVAIYNTSFVYRLHLGYTLSIKQLYRALQLVVKKHESLRTSLIFHKEKNLLKQQIIDLNDSNNALFSLIESMFETDEQINKILYDEQQNTQHFDISQGLVFRCHLVYYKEISANDLLSDKDVIIFNFHHALFDFSSMNIFLHDLNQAYTTGQLLYDDNTHLRYLDYAVIEQQMSMTGASMFWLDALHDCKLDQPLPLPYDRYRLPSEHRTDRVTSISFDFGPNLSQYFLIYVSSNNISSEHLILAIYFLFLLKLTNGEDDLCIGMTVDNRYRDEFKSIIGLFENIIPLRCQLDPQWSFHQLLACAQEFVTKSMKYSYFPLQRILDQHSNISNPAFIKTSFEFISTTIQDNKNTIILNDNQLSLLPFSPKISGNEIMNKYDFITSFQHNLDVNVLSCTINASLDVFNVETIDNISQRFHSMLKQLFTSVDDQTNKSIHEISLTLANERLLMQS